MNVDEELPGTINSISLLEFSLPSTCECSSRMWRPSAVNEANVCIHSWHFIDTARGRREQNFRFGVVFLSQE